MHGARLITKTVHVIPCLKNKNQTVFVSYRHLDKDRPLFFMVM